MGNYTFQVYWRDCLGEEHYSEKIHDPEMAVLFRYNRIMAGCRESEILIIEEDNIVSDLLGRLNGR